MGKVFNKWSSYALQCRTDKVFSFCANICTEQSVGCVYLMEVQKFTVLQKLQQLQIFWQLHE